MKTSRILHFLLLLAVLASTAWASMSAHYVVTPYVRGFPDSASVSIYVNTGAEGYDIRNFGLEWTFPDGVTATDVKAGEAIATGCANAIMKPSENGAITMVMSFVGNAAIKAKDTDQLFATITLAVAPGLQDSFAITATAINQPQGWDPTEAQPVSYTSGTTCVFPQSVTIPNIEPFNFLVKNDALFETDEDTAMTIDPNDTARFSCLTWNGDDFVDGTAKFTAASLEDDSAGFVNIENGKIIFTPAIDFNGSIVINFTAANTDQSITTTISESLTMIVNAVNDAPIMGITSYPAAVTEQTAITTPLNFTVSDVDSTRLSWKAFVCDEAALTAEAAEALWTNCVSIADGIINLDAEGTARIANAINNYRFPYGFVEHPDTVRAAYLVVAVTDGETFDVLSKPLTINDKDQISTAPVIAINTDEYKRSDKTITVSLATASTDADAEDEILYYELDLVNGSDAKSANVNPEELHNGFNWDISDFAEKGKTYELTAVAFSGKGSFKDHSQSSTPVVVACLNSKPVLAAEEATLPIIMDGIEGPQTGEIVLTFEDADGDKAGASEFVASKGFFTEKSRKGNTITVVYTVLDSMTEFFGATADMTSIKYSDGTEYSEPVEIEISYRSPCPWFPFYELTCNCFEGLDDDQCNAIKHIVTITQDGKSVASLEVNGKTIYPRDYFGRTVGLLTDGIYEVTARNLDNTEDCIFSIDADTIVTDYTAPEVAIINNVPNIDGTYDADENNIFNLDFEIPMASRYTITVTDPVGTLTRVDGIFKPEGNDIIIYPVVTEKLKLSKAGQYTVTIKGFNPSFDGPDSAPITINVAQDANFKTDWDYSKFVPATGASQLTQDVVFCWSNYGNATNYTLTLINNSDSTKKSYAVSGTSTAVTLPYGSYCWYVLADGTNASNIQTLNIVNPSMQHEGWETLVGAQYNMSLYAVINDYDGNRVEAPGSALAVFDAQGICRGIAEIEAGPKGILWYQMTIVSNAVRESGLVLKVLDKQTGEIHDIKETIDFVSDTTLPAENYTTSPLVLHYRPLTVELALALVQNWNWVSFNVEQDERSIGEFLADYAQYATDGDIIKSQNGQATYSGGQWYASPKTFRLEPGRMYKLRKQKAGNCQVTVTGVPCTGEEPIAVTAGWTWLGYTGQAAATVGALFREGGFADNDLVKPQSGNQATFSDGQWYGNLVFQPGKGYMLRQTVSGTVDFRNAEENKAQ